MASSFCFYPNTSAVVFSFDRRKFIVNHGNFHLSHQQRRRRRRQTKANNSWSVNSCQRTHAPWRSMRVTFQIVFFANGADFMGCLRSKVQKRLPPDNYMLVAVIHYALICVTFCLCAQRCRAGRTRGCKCASPLHRGVLAGVLISRKVATAEIFPASGTVMPDLQSNWRVLLIYEIIDPQFFM